MLVNSTISSSISLGSQAVVPFDFILEKMKAVVLASTLKTAMTFSIDPAVSRIMGKAKKAVKAIVMRKAKHCEWLSVPGDSGSQTLENDVFSFMHSVTKKRLDSESIDITNFIAPILHEPQKASRVWRRSVSCYLANTIKEVIKIPGQAGVVFFRVDLTPCAKPQGVWVIGWREAILAVFQH